MISKSLLPLNPLTASFIILYYSHKEFKLIFLSITLYLRYLILQTTSRKLVGRKQGELFSHTMFSSILRIHLNTIFIK